MVNKIITNVLRSLDITALAGVALAFILFLENKNHVVGSKYPPIRGLTETDRKSSNQKLWRPKLMSKLKFMTNLHKFTSHDQNGIAQFLGETIIVFYEYHYILVDDWLCSFVVLIFIYPISSSGVGNPFMSLLFWHSTLH